MSLLKARQFAELLAGCTGVHAGMDCQSMTFDEVLRLLRRQSLIPKDVASHFDVVRLSGNAANHEGQRDRNAALRSLVCAHELAKWFIQRVLKNTEFQDRPFRPLPKPEDASRELQEEIEILRNQAASAQLAVDATETQVQEMPEKLASCGKYLSSVSRESSHGV